MNTIKTDQPLALKSNEGLGPHAQDLTGDVAWLWTHCRALGMTRSADSGLMRDDVALYAADLHAALRELVACKELKERIESADLSTYDMADAEAAQKLADQYARRKPAAWHAARAALGPNAELRDRPCGPAPFE